MGISKRLIKIEQIKSRLSANNLQNVRLLQNLRGFLDILLSRMMILIKIIEESYESKC